MYPHTIGVYLELMEYSLRQWLWWEHGYMDPLVCQKVHTKINKGRLPPSYWNLLKDNEIFLEARGMVKVWPFWYSILSLYNQPTVHHWSRLNSLDQSGMWIPCQKVHTRPTPSLTMVLVWVLVHPRFITTFTIAHQIYVLQFHSKCKYNSREYAVAYGAFTLDIKSVLNENLGDILGGT